jgi:L-ascorbate metabolism protein UlaG (beta-lactamase superfamily)
VSNPWRAEPDALERLKELDHEHRKRLRGALPLTLSLQYLATAFDRLRSGTEPVRAALVPRPVDDTVSVTFVGHATVMVTTPRTRILTDPLLESSMCGLRRAKAAGVHADDAGDVDLILISHAHRDHLSPRTLRRLPRSSTVVVPPRCAALVRRLGYDAVVELAPGRAFTHADVEVTAVPVRHSGARRGACGYVIRALAGPTSAAAGACLYFAGDTGYFSGFGEIGRRFQPDVALLPIGGYEPAGFREEHMSPLDAVYAFEDLGARVLVPIGYGSFPLSYEPLDAPVAWLREAARARGISLSSTGKDRRVAVLDHGETAHFRKRCP